MLEDETALGLWQPPLASTLLQGLSAQYQAYLWLDRRYGTELPATQVLLQEYALATLFYATMVLSGPKIAIGSMSIVPFVPGSPSSRLVTNRVAWYP
jgi:hypothetical protein